MNRSDVVFMVIMPSALVMTILRFKAIDLLKEKKLYSKFDEPRKFFFSDVLPIRLLSLCGGRLTIKENMLIASLFASWLIGLAAIFYQMLVFVIGGDNREVWSW